MEIKTKIIQYNFTLTKKDKNIRNEQKKEESPLMQKINKAKKSSKNLFKTEEKESKNINKIKDANKFNLFKTVSKTEKNNDKIVFNNSDKKNEENEKINNIIKKMKKKDKYDYKIGKSEGSKNDVLDGSNYVEKKILDEGGPIDNPSDETEKINYNEKMSENLGIINNDVNRNKNNYSFCSKNINNLEKVNSNINL